MAKQFKGLKSYEKDICTMLNYESFENLSKEEMDGCLGVAMVMSYVWDGVSPTMFDFSNWLNLSPVVLEQAYNRLKINGIFSSDYNARKDMPLLMGLASNKKSPDWSMNLEWETIRSQKAYGVIHGIAAGFAGIR